MFGLEPTLAALLIVCLIFVCAFEFVNGFHDTANAVATVIYTNSLKPIVAVVWSGFCNFVGVFSGGIAVAMSIINLLPLEALADQSIYLSIAMVLSLIISAIIWNLATWYVGLPASSSHALVGSIIGAGIAFSFMPENSLHEGVNWSKAGDIGLSLLISPVFGFSMAVLLMAILAKNVKRKDIFDEPKKDAPPPTIMRILSITTCTLVSFFHGSNDGQKGVGLVMIILISIIPGYFALNHNINTHSVKLSLEKIDHLIATTDTAKLKEKDLRLFSKSKLKIQEAESIINQAESINQIPEKQHFILRKNIVSGCKGIEKLIEKGKIKMMNNDLISLKKEIKECKKITDYSPLWVLVMVSISIGLGTMIGWKRIVRTIGEKIGKTHLSYAQGFSSEIVASSTIGLSTWLGLPVSTTHVLSSGVAGAMVSGKGFKNLQPKTIRNILLAWVLTLPVCMIMSFGLFWLLRAIML
ncbi:MAG: inorganic phosphate transporter [Bacteroidia bacterium]|nr:inorganic phosphate transporter [Bacteroidia bacterium]